MKIDINCDLGEGKGNDAALMPLISSCNIACGGHAGNAKTMSNALRLAQKYGIKVGAHPSFPDKDNFGRKIPDIPTAALTESLINQILSLKKEADKLHLKLHHIKPHGALYNLAVKDTQTAMAVVEAIKKTNLKVKLYAPFKSVIADIATHLNIPVIYEAFLDRRYNTDLTLVSRQNKDALIPDPKEVYKQLCDIRLHQKVKSIFGVYISLKANTFCIHGDNTNAVTILKYLHAKFAKSSMNLA